MAFVGFNFGKFWGGSRRTAPTPQQLRDDGASEAMKIDQRNQVDDARYDSMTDAQRDAYYVHPNVRTRLQKWLKGS